MKIRTTSVTFFALALCLSGCAGRHVAAPEQFVELESTSGSAKFVAADDAQLWVRRFVPEADGDLAFWRDHLKRHFTSDRGYTLIADKDVTVAGAPGVEFTFEATVDGLLRRYALVLCIEPGLFRDRVLTAEFIGTPESFAAHEAAIRTALEVQ